MKIQVKRNKVILIPQDEYDHYRLGKLSMELNKWSFGWESYDSGKFITDFEIDKDEFLEFVFRSTLDKS